MVADDDPYAKLKKQVEMLREQYNDLALDESDAGQSKRAELKARLRRLTHDQIHPGEEQVRLNVPLAVTGEPFRINERPYVGDMTVPACVAQTLLHMIDQNRKVDIDRMKEQGRTSLVGQIGNLAQRSD